MAIKRTIRRHDDAFKNKAVKLVLEQGYSVPQAEKALGIATSLLYNMKAQQTQTPTLNPDEKAELIRLRKENKQPKMEQEILKKAGVESMHQYPVRLLCKVMKISFSAFYAASTKPWNAISPEQMRLKARIETLFEEKNKRIGSRQMLGILKFEGFKIGRYKVSKLMKQLGLYCLQRKAKPKSKNGQSDRIKPNLLN